VTVLVIDGYNLLHAMIRAEGRRELGETLEEGRLEDERHHLLDRVASYLGGTRDRAIVVFDARKSKLEKQSVSARNVEVFFGSFDRSADSIIERVAYTLPEYEGIIVVSSDYDVQKTVFRANVTRRSSAQFVQDLTDHTKKVAEFGNCTTMGHRVEDRIDAETLRRLQALREALEGRQPAK
jgi:predicted RNA-binding protein with PIN domain